MGLTKQGNQESTEGNELIFRDEISVGTHIQPTVKFLTNCLRLVKVLLLQFYCEHWNRKSMRNPWSVLVHRSNTLIIFNHKAYFNV